MLTLNILYTFSSVSIVDFEQVNIDWVVECGIKISQCTGSFIIHSEYNPVEVASVFLFWKQPLGVFYKKSAPYCQVSLLRTLVKLFFMKRLFSQDTFFLGHFTREKNIFILPGIQVLWCKKLIQNRSISQGIQLLNKTLDLPGHCKYLPVISLRIKKNAIILPRSEQIPQKTIYLSILGKLVNLY